jgi:hypothetical protein
MGKSSTAWFEKKSIDKLRWQLARQWSFYKPFSLARVSGH